jgi:hypothetical protein
MYCMMLLLVSELGWVERTKGLETPSTSRSTTRIAKWTAELMRLKDYLDCSSLSLSLSKLIGTPPHHTLTHTLVEPKSANPASTSLQQPESHNDSALLGCDVLDRLGRYSACNHRNGVDLNQGANHGLRIGHCSYQLVRIPTRVVRLRLPWRPARTST